MSRLHSTSYSIPRASIATTTLTPPNSLNALTTKLFGSSREEANTSAAMPLSHSYEIFTTLLIITITIVVSFQSRTKSKMPPGPKPKPFVGNKWDLPVRKPWETFKKWTDSYGALVTVWTGRQPTIILGDPKAANDLLEKRSAIYSSRPRFVIMGELFTNNDSLLTMPYGKRWIHTRKLFHWGLNKMACQSYKPIQEAESQRLVRDLLESPTLYAKHLERYAASVMVCVSYGRRVDMLDDPVVKRVYDRMGYMATLNVPGAYWAETFPILKYVPDCFAPWKREVKRRGDEGTQLLLDLALDVKKRMESPEGAPASFAKLLWERYGTSQGPLTEREVAYATGSLFGAGSDTTASALQTFILAMTCFPNVAETAREELDRVVGRHRSPTWDDMPNLPYCAAIIKETLRWRPVSVLGGTPHATTQDDTYEGHFIPKGSTVLGNLWAIHHNPKYFKDSHSFIPERYLDENEVREDGTQAYPHRDGHSAFGWGRRICPGKLLAENSLYITITRMLWCLRISKATDDNGNIIEPNIFNYTDGFNSKPNPFQCKIEARDEHFAEVLRREAIKAEQFLEQYRPE